MKTAVCRIDSGRQPLFMLLHIKINVFLKVSKKPEIFIFQAFSFIFN